MVESPEATLGRYNACSGSHFPSRELVVLEWNDVIDKGVGMGSISRRRFKDRLQRPEVQIL